VIWEQRPSTEDLEEHAGDQGPGNLLETFRLVRQSRHLQAIAALICLSSIVTTAAGWQLKAIAKATFVQKDVLTAFLGGFQGYAGIAALVAQLLITTKLLRRFGVGVALLVLPVSLGLGSVAVAMWGTLWAATVLKGSDLVFRYSVDTSALQLLYLPVPANIKLHVKSFIDTVIWRLGDGLAGLTLLVFATHLQFTPREISWVNLVMLCGWIVAAMIARHQYVATLRDNIQRIRIQPEQTTVPVLDQFTSNVFAEKLHSKDTNEVIYALNLFEMSQQLHAHSAVRNLLEHPSSHVRAKAISILNTAGDVSVRHHVTGLLNDNDLQVRTEALLYLSRHGEIDPLTHVERLRDFGDFSIRSATIVCLMRPGEFQNVEAARMITDGTITDLGDASLAPDAIRTLVLLGDIVVDALNDHLADSSGPPEVRISIPDVLLRIGTTAAAQALAGNLIQPDAELRSKVISALNKICELVPEVNVDRQMIESALIAEMMGHYRSYQILGISGGQMDGELKAAMTDELERIFRLMKLLFPSIDLQNAYWGIQSADPILHANALEFLDNTLKPDLRTRLVPLLDSEVSLRERIHLADRFLGFSVQA
jgi:hypothetical protein